jgi:hypothetical protein
MVAPRRRQSYANFLPSERGHDFPARSSQPETIEAQNALAITGVNRRARATATSEFFNRIDSSADFGLNRNRPVRACTQTPS